MNSTDIVWDRDAYLSLGRKLKVQIWLFIVIFFFTFCWSVKATALLFRARYIKYRGLKLTNGLDSTEIVAISTLAAATFRFLWSLDSRRFFDYPFSLFGSGFRVFILKLPQILMINSVLFLIVVWRDLVNRSKKLKRTSETKKLFRVVLCLSLILSFITMPITVLYTNGIVGEFTNSLADLTFSLYTLGLLIAGVRYSFQLRKLCEIMANDFGRIMIMKVRRIVIQTLIPGVIIISAVIRHTLDQDTANKHFQYWYFIHLCEAGFLCMLCRAVSPYNLRSGGFRSMIKLSNFNSKSQSQSEASEGTSRKKIYPQTKSQSRKTQDCSQNQLSSGENSKKSQTPRPVQHADK